MIRRTRRAREFPNGMARIAKNVTRSNGVRVEFPP